VVMMKYSVKRIPSTIGWFIFLISLEFIKYMGIIKREQKKERERERERDWCENVGNKILLKNSIIDSISITIL